MTRAEEQMEEREKKVLAFLALLGGERIEFDGYKQSYRFYIGGALVEIIDQKHRVVAHIWRKPKDRTEDLLFRVWRAADWRSLPEGIDKELEVLFAKQELFLSGNYLTTFKQVVDGAKTKFPQ